MGRKTSEGPVVLATLEAAKTAVRPESDTSPRAWVTGSGGEEEEADRR